MKSDELTKNTVCIIALSGNYNNIPSGSHKWGLGKLFLVFKIYNFK